MLLALASFVVAGACDSEERPSANQPGGSPSPAPTPTKIEVVAREYEFEAPSSLPAGHTSFILVNEGKQDHELVIFKLKTQRSARQVLRLSQKEGRKLVEEVGGTFARPGQTSRNPVRARLSAGDYALVCFVPAAGGTPHYAKGMVSEISVE